MRDEGGIVMNNENFLKILDWLVENDAIEYGFIYKDEGQFKFSLNLNDYFAWACADGEDITVEDLPELDKAIADCRALFPQDKENESAKYVYGKAEGLNLWACRKNKLRPQGCCYPSHKFLWPLFDAAGPFREKGLGNPYAPGEREELRAKQKDSK